jgi:hypothetical protein
MGFHELTDLTKHVFDVFLRELVPLAMGSFVSYISQRRYAFLRQLAVHALFGQVRVHSV